MTEKILNNNKEVHILMIKFNLFLIEWMLGNQARHSRKHLPFIHINMGGRA